jgi:Zn-dependent protease
MMPTRQGSFRLFRVLGIDVFLHWSWFLIAVYDIQSRSQEYNSLVWNAMEYLALFAIVLLHEFGHALACRQVGGQANLIVLWPLGGVAYVSPPQRPGAMLWSIAAGPLVNVALFPILSGARLLSHSLGWAETMPNAYTLIWSIWFTNLFLLIFNLFPVYPLDGGQILRSLLWFVFGRARSLMIAASIGFVGVAGLAAFAFWARSVWLGILAAFILLNCWRGLMNARALLKLANAPRREGFFCPDCRTAPPVGLFWGCGKCGKKFDTFASQAVCPHCGAQYVATACAECGTLHPIVDWALHRSEALSKY